MKSYKTTITASFVGYIVQAIVNNFVPLLFITLQNEYSIPLSEITLLITVNFIVQLTVDVIAIRFVDKIGYRASVIAAHVFSCFGLASLSFLPEVFSDPYIGIMISVVIYAVGGGLLEVVISPIIEACPTDNKEKAMSLLHSFYCWGQVGVVLISTVFFSVFGIENWRILILLWAVVPLVNGFVFIKTPINSLIESGEKELSLKELFSEKSFPILMLMMVCAGASEMGLSQWSSAFAEQGLGVDKTLGDLFGPMMFAVFMGTARLIFGKFGDRINLDRYMILSAVLCVAAYLTVSLVPVPVVGLIGCGICGFSVGIFWPGTFSKASASIKGGGTAMFALLALAGDFGCSSGPTVAGFASSLNNNDLRTGILFAVIFPAVMLVGIIIHSFISKSEK